MKTSNMPRPKSQSFRTVALIMALLVLAPSHGMAQSRAYGELVDVFKNASRKDSAVINSGGAGSSGLGRAGGSASAIESAPAPIRRGSILSDDASAAQEQQRLQKIQRDQDALEAQRQAQLKKDADDRTAQKAADEKRQADELAAKRKADEEALAATKRQQEADTRAAAQQEEKRLSSEKFESKSAEQMASELRDKIDKNSVSYTTPTTKGHIDLAGKDHGPVPTPHVQEQKIHYGPEGQFNLSRQETRPATKQDVRTARKIAEKQGGQ